MTSRPIGNPSAHGVRALVLAILPMAAPFLFDATALAMPITISSNVTAVSGDITINNGETAGPGDDVIVTGTGKVNAMNGSVFINTGDNIDLQAGSTITASNALNLHAGVSDIDGIGDITIVGLVQASGPVAAVAGPGDDTVTVDFPNGASPPRRWDGCRHRRRVPRAVARKRNGSCTHACAAPPVAGCAFASRIGDQRIAHDEAIEATEVAIGSPQLPHPVNAA
jgi:hypothetical protein